MRSNKPIFCKCGYKLNYFEKDLSTDYNEYTGKPRNPKTKCTLMCPNKLIWFDSHYKETWMERREKDINVPSQDYDYSY